MTAATKPRPSTRAVPEVLVLVAFLAATYGVAALGSLATADNAQGWYASAEKPPLTPPDWLFGPVWTVLYALIAISGWLVWRQVRRAGHPALWLWWIQLGLNLAWTPVFFALQWLWPALGVILALDAVVVLTIIRFRRISPVAAALLVPYLLWIVFATWLNLGVAWLR